ncbi:GMC oxidoreductase-domain-containing protein [Terfezia claveryi]|nr:GMC oxidoreductase-domain-containing protein [Terfezia claveryi]
MPSTHRTFTPAQLETFLSIADTFIPALTPAELDSFRVTLSKDLPHKSDAEWARILVFAQTPASESEGFMTAVGSMERNLNSAQWKAMSEFESRSMRVGALILCRTWTPFPRLSLSTRTSILQMWRASPFTTYHHVFKSVFGLIRYCYAQTPTIYAGINIPQTDPDANSPRYHEKKESFHKYVFSDLSLPDAALDTDILIVGTGAGGGVVAKKVSEWASSRGVRVLVVEQGEYVPHEELVMTESECVQRMWERGVMTVNTEGTLAIGYGRTFGGGTAINWSVSLRTPGAVRREWASYDVENGGGGVGWFQSKEFSEALERVERRMGVSTANLVHNTPNRIMLEACEVLGYRIEETPVNTGGHRHSCSYCGHGCRYGEKMGTMNSWLVDASLAGARFAEKVSVRRVLFAEGEDTGEGGRKRRKKVIGVEALVGDDGDRKKIILYLTCTLLGHHLLRLAPLPRAPPPLATHQSSHRRAPAPPPSNLSLWLLPPTHPHAPIHPHLGPVISTVITETANLSPAPFNSYGSRIEAGYMFPLVGLAQLPWLSGEKLKNYLARYENMIGIFSLARDGRWGGDGDGDGDGGVRVKENTGGRVTLDPTTGEPVFSYRCHPSDCDSLIEGLVVAGQVLLTAGASEIVSSIRGLPPYLHPKGEPTTNTTTTTPDIRINTPAFRAWQKSLRALASKPDNFPLSSAHQMGSNRMCGVSWESGDSTGVGIGPDGKIWRGGGVVDPEGRVYGVEGMYVVDASVLPGAAGVNPMLSVMGVAEVLGGRMCRRWESEGWWEEGQG